MAENDDALAKLFRADQSHEAFTEIACTAAKAVLKYEAELIAGGMPSARAFRLAETMSEVFWQMVFAGKANTEE